MELTAAQHKELGIALFNETWMYLDTSARTSAQDFQMMDMAHASAYHWSFAGDHVNELRSQWQLSRVYAVLSMGESALCHALRSLSLCQEHAVKGFDLAFAYEAMARAYAVLKDAARTKEYKNKALALAAEIEDEGDRAYTLGEINSIA
ncbi:MAG TPA: hypothetical protein PKB13_05685 [Clostridia bacterium]|nr:hypothetical protein [Clostridia bacterium]